MNLVDRFGSMLSMGRTAPFKLYTPLPKYLTVNELATIDDQIFELETRLEESRSNLRDLATMGAIIASIMDIETILSVVMEMAIRTVEGEVGLIQLQEQDRLVTKIAWGVDDASIRNIIYRDDRDVSTYCFRQKKQVLWNAGDEGKSFGPTITGFLALPLQSRARCHGTIVIINKTSGERFTPEDGENLGILVNYAAVAIDNSLLLKESLEKQRMEQELALASQVQEAILPDKETNLTGVETGIIYRPARVVGGDFYDLIRIDEAAFYLIIGDVSNKGIPAAMVMAATAAIIRTALKNTPAIEPADLMQCVNDILCRGVIKHRDMYVTLFVARLNVRERQLLFCNAGHLPPLLWDARKQSVAELRDGGPFVGQFPETIYNQGESDINVGDRLFAFTDGLSEAVDVHNTLLGLKRVKEIFLAEKDLPPAQFCARVKEYVDRYSAGAPEDTRDDFTLLQMRLVPGEL